jgi:UDP-glucose 4-epimerase
VHGASVFTNGTVLVTGGLGYTGVSISAELYDPSAGTWSFVSDMNYDRFYHTSSFLTNGEVLVTGGASTNTAELY